MTGENKILQVDILHDAGKAINPAIELGQIEGGFVQGAGWLTMEEVKWKSNGQITTHSPSQLNKLSLKSHYKLISNKS